MISLVLFGRCTKENVDKTDVSLFTLIVQSKVTINGSLDLQ
jgi:hypothetical protein